MALRASKVQQGDEKDPLSLHELTRRIAAVVNEGFADPLWVVAELSDVRVASNGHCYMTLVEKEPRRGTTLASVRGMIWSNRWWLLRDSFVQQTGQQFATGLKVMILVQVTMHEQYGLSLNILDIDPTYTLGEMARRRMEILRQLKEDGIIDMNRELTFPILPQRIAIISAEGAAGYGDFIKQLSNNAYGLKFYAHLFPATMQGQQTEPSVIAALDRINEVEDLFDVVVIIRGGGTVLDHVAHTSVKTPTAAAALLIDTLYMQMQKVLDLHEEIKDNLQQRMDLERQHLQRLGNVVRNTHVMLAQQISRLDIIGQRIQSASRQMLSNGSNTLDTFRQAIQMLSRQRIQREKDKLEFIDRTIQLAQPDNILKRGFTITRLDGHAVKSAASVPPGSTLTIQTADGTLTAETK